MRLAARSANLAARFARHRCTAAGTTADDGQNKIVVFGGGGYVGGAVCRAALAAGLKVTSVNRSGAPSDDEWTKEVEWVEGGCRLAALGRA